MISGIRLQLSSTCTPVCLVFRGRTFTLGLLLYTVSVQFSDLHKCEENKVILSFFTKVVFSASNFLGSGMLVKKLPVVIFLPR